MGLFRLDEKANDSSVDIFVLLNKYMHLMTFLQIRKTIFFSLFLLPFIVSAQWSNLANSNEKKFEGQTVLHNGKVYSLTGFNLGINIVSGLEVYDPDLDSWTVLAPMPLSKHETNASEAGVTHMGVGLVGDSIWVVGGRTGSHPGTLTDEVWIYNINTNTWSDGPDLPVALAGGGLVVLERTIYVFGGFSSACNGDQSSYHVTLDVDALLANPALTWENVRAPMPNPRNHIGATAFGGKIYALGGQLGHDCCASGIPCGNDVTFADRYDPVSDSWESLANLPYPRSHVEAATYTMDGSIFISSSETGATISNTTMEFNPDLNSWSINDALELPDGILAPILRPIGNSLYLFTGGYGGVNNPTDSSKVLSLSRTPSHTLGFSQDTVSFLIYQNGVEEGSNFIWTEDGVAAYTLSAASAPAWLSLGNPTTGSVDRVGKTTRFSVSASGLTQGTYYAKIAVTGSGPNVISPASTVTFTPDSFVVKLEVGPSPDGIVVMNSADACVDIEVGSSSIRTISLATPGAISVNISSITLSDPTHFQLLSPLPASIAAAGSENMDVTFAPLVSGTHSTDIIVTHDGTNSPTTVTISCSSVDPCTVPVDWVSVDLGSPFNPGSGCESNGVYQLAGGGKDFWSSKDEGHFLGTRVVGDGEIVIKMNSVEAIDDWTKAGIMMRSSLDADSKNAFICITPSNGVSFQYRKNTDDKTDKAQSSGLSAPQWLKLERIGDVITGYFSSDGLNWIQVNGGNNPQTVVLGDTIWAGPAMTSHDDTQLATAEGEFLSMTFTSATFPVELLSFSGKRVEEGVVLQWESALEEAFSHYEVTRVDEQNVFRSVGRVEAQGTGVYQFIDTNPVSTTSLYRLSMVDIDGSVSYSSLVEITDLSPKPFIVVSDNDKVNITWQIESESLEVRFIDLTGRIVWQDRISPRVNSTQQIDTQRLPSGWYHIQIVGKEKIAGQSLILR